MLFEIVTRAANFTGVRSSCRTSRGIPSGAFHMSYLLWRISLGAPLLLWSSSSSWCFYISCFNLNNSNKFLYL
jgi:hypothetical protein